MNTTGESYLEKCIVALPPEKRVAARAAFAEIAENGDDSYLSKLLAVLEANNAYAKAIPRDLAAVHQRFLEELEIAAAAIRRKQLEADVTRDAALQKLLHDEVRVLNKTLPLTQAIEVVQEQNRTLNQLKPAIIEGSHKLRAYTAGLFVGLLIGGLVGGYVIGLRAEMKVREARHAKAFMDYVAVTGITLTVVPSGKGEMLRIQGSAPVSDARWQRDEKGKITGAEIDFPSVAAK